MPGTIVQRTYEESKAIHDQIRNLSNMKRSLSPEEEQKAEDMALDYMHNVADTIEAHDGKRPSELQLAAQASKIAEHTKKLWRLSPSPISSMDESV